jgi:hypothetical protein
LIIARREGFLKESRDMEKITAPVNGSAQPIFIAGVRYKSMFLAAIETDISTVWIYKMLKASRGFPVLIKRHMVATERWVQERVASFMGAV